MHRKYTAADFDDDLRTVLRRSGCRDEKIVFILDESNMLDSSFLERMNTLLANGEVRETGECNASRTVEVPITETLPIWRNTQKYSIVRPVSFIERYLL